MIVEFATADPRVSGLARAVGTTVLYVTGGAIVPLAKYSIGNTDWCTLPQGGAATPSTSDPRVAGRAAAVGTVVMYVTGGAGVLLRKYGPTLTNWATVPVISGGAGGTLTDGNKGDITVASAGSAWAINAGVVGTSRLGVDITTAGKALLDDADAAAQRTTLGLGSAATTAATAYEAAGGIATHAAVTSAVHGISAFGATLVDDANAATARTTLGLATIASSASAGDITAGTLATARLGSGTATATTFLRGDQTWATPAGGGSGSGASGTATVNFGAFPGVHETFASISDAGVVAGSVIHCSIRPAVTADHSADEHYAEAPNFALVVQSISAGVGFEVWARYQPPVPEPLQFPGAASVQRASVAVGQNTNQQPTIVPSVGGRAPRTYGQWTIQWIRI
jgi:hypothetical protein